MNQQDWALMQEVAAGDEEAIGTLYDRFGALVFKSARQVLPTRAEAEDAVQEVFVRLWQSADRYDPRRARLVTWVMLITRRHLIDRLRRKAVRPTMMQFDSDFVGAGAGDDKRDADDERVGDLMQRVKELPALQREVIEKAYFQGFTLREVSEQLDAPLGTVKSALSRGLAKLRERSTPDEKAM